MSVQLHIERLVLDEALLGDERAPAVRAAIEQQLGRLLAGQDASIALQRIGSVASLPHAVLLAASHPHDRLGSRIATAVQRSLGVTPFAAPGTPGAER